MRMRAIASSFCLWSFAIRNATSHGGAMKPSAMFVLLCLAISLLCSAQEKAVPEIPYESVPNLLKLPSDLYLGEVAGVAVNSKGHIFVYTRSAQTRLFEFDAKGNFVREIGKDLYGFSFAHVVRIDKDDNIWCVDEGANMVIEFDPQGRGMMLFCRKPATGGGGGAPPPRPTGPPPPLAAPRPPHLRHLPLRPLPTGCSTGPPTLPGILPEIASSPTDMATHAW